MNILVLLPRCPFPARDGGSIVFSDTISALKREGHAVHAFCLLPDTFTEDMAPLTRLVDSVETFPIRLALQKKDALLSLVRPQNLSGFVHADVTSSYWVERYVSDDALEALKSYAKGLKVDAVLCESLFTACYGIALKEHRLISEDTPVVLHAHNVESMIQQTMSKDENRPLWERIVRKRLFEQTHKYEKWVVRNIDGVAALSTADSDIFQTMSKKTPVVAIEPGVSVTEGDPAAVAANQACILASLDWVPNVSGIEWFVSEVLPKILEKAPEFVLHIAGRNPHPRVRKLHNDSTIIVHGEVDDAGRFRKDHGVFVVPVHSGSGVRIKILEALADARPVVSTTIGAQGLRLKNGSDLLIADQPDDMASALVALTRDTERAQKMGIEGRYAMIREYGQDSVGRSLTSFLRQSL